MMRLATRLKTWAAVAGGFLIAMLVAFQKGKSRARADQRAADDRAYRDTREELDGIKPFETAEDAVDYLRNRD